MPKKCCPPAKGRNAMTTRSGDAAKSVQNLATLAKALGHPARVQIVRFLLSQDSCMCGDIVEHLPLAQSTVSQHLKMLKESGSSAAPSTGRGFATAWSRRCSSASSNSSPASSRGVFLPKSIVNRR